MRCLFVVAVVLLQRGDCLKCYSCSSMGTQECWKPDRNRVPLVDCNSSGLQQTKIYAANMSEAYRKLFDVDVYHQEPQVPINCLKQVTKVGDNEVVLRGCQLAASDGLDICVKVKKVGIDTLRTTHCSLCNSDRCNAASVNRPLTFVLTTLLSCYLLYRQV